jgi:hypothetical protein
MLAREGLSFAALKRMEEQEESSAEDVVAQAEPSRHEDDVAVDERELVTRAESRR